MNCWADTVPIYHRERLAHISLVLIDANAQYKVSQYCSLRSNKSEPVIIHKTEPKTNTHDPSSSANP
jgi:hypothetical protein